MAARTDIRSRTVSGLGWTASSQVIQVAAQFAFTATLARLLTPHQFGLIALVAVLTGFVFVFVDFGLAAAIVQRATLDERHRSSAFWVNLAAGVVLMLLTMAVAPGMAAFFHQPRLLGLTIAVAPDFVFAGLGIVQMALLQREMNFKRVAMIENANLVLSNAFGVGLALAGFGVWSLVGLMLASTGFRSALLWFLSDWRPTWQVDRAAVRELWRFSSRLAGFNALTYWGRNADNLLVGKFVGTAPLAFYNRAYNLMLLPVSTVASVTSRVMFPVLSRIQENREQVKSVYLRAVGLIAFATFPAMVGLLVVARPFILTIYGPRWEKVVPLLQILCIPSLIQCMTRTTGWIFQSQGRSDIMFRWGLVSTVTVICSFFIGLPWGVKGVAAAYGGWNLLVQWPAIYLAGRLIDVSLKDVLDAIWGVAAASAVMGGVVWAVEHEIPGSWGTGTQLGAGVGAGAVVYFIALHLFSPRPYREFRQLLGEYQWRRAPLNVASS